MIDLHTHILPAVDDGSHSVSESLAMAEMALDNGTNGIAATSHGNIGELTVEKYREAFFKLRERLVQEHLPLQLYTGMEILMDHEVPDKLDAGKLLTLNDTKYILIEFHFDEELWMVKDYLQMLEETEYIPVIAHAERYEFVQRHPEEVYNWVRSGIVIQANKGSFLGAFGRKARETALSLLSHNLIQVVASDAHGVEHRTTQMRNAARFLNDTVSPKYRELVLSENPGRILRGEEVLTFPPKPYRQNHYW